MGIRERDRELLILVAEDSVDDSDSKASASLSVATHLHFRREAFCKVVRSWDSEKFMTGCVILLPIAITFYITLWFIHFVDGFFSPIYAQLGINIFGLGFITSITFIFLVGVFMSSWLGASVLSLNQNKRAFKEVTIIRHPRNGEYAFGFITSAVVLQNYSDEEEL